jgi:hypothetical protein
VYVKCVDVQMFNNSLREKGLSQLRVLSKEYSE